MVFPSLYRYYEISFTHGVRGYPREIINEITKLLAEDDRAFCITCEESEIRELRFNEAKELFASYDLTLPEYVKIRAAQKRCSIKLGDNQCMLTAYGNHVWNGLERHANFHQVLSCLWILRKTPEFNKLNKWKWLFEAPVVKAEPTFPAIEMLIDQALANVLLAYCIQGSSRVRYIASAEVQSVLVH